MGSARYRRPVFFSLQIASVKLDENTSTFLEVMSGKEEVKIVENSRVFGRISGFPKDKIQEPTEVLKINTILQHVIS